MTLYDFIRLDEKEKKFNVIHQGVLISKRKLPGSIIFLFQLNDFYIEVFSSLVSKEITSYQVFKHTQLLEPYIKEIAIDDVFKN